MDPVPPPVSPMMTVRVYPEVVVVNFRVVDVAIDVDVVENFGVPLVRAVPTDLADG